MQQNFHMLGEVLGIGVMGGRCARPCAPYSPDGFQHVLIVRVRFVGPLMHSGVDNVAGVDLCMRRQDAVAFIMPFVRHDKFHDYFNRFDARELQQYMRNLLVALRRVHSFGIIHRDVKPSNFLHDRKAKKYLLVDFGLAQSVAVPAAATQASTVVAPVALTPPVGRHTPQTISFSNTSTGNDNPQPLPTTTKKRKAAEIEETENCSNGAGAAATTTTMMMAAAAASKRARPNQPHSHNNNTTTQYSNETGENGSAPATAPLPAATSAFKTPLKQLNEISMPKTGAAAGQPTFKK